MVWLTSTIFSAPIGYDPAEPLHNSFAHVAVVRIRYARTSFPGLHSEAFLLRIAFAQVLRALQELCRGS